MTTNGSLPVPEPTASEVPASEVTASEPIPPDEQAPPAAAGPAARVTFDKPGQLALEALLIAWLRFKANAAVWIGVVVLAAVVVALAATVSVGAVSTADRSGATAVAFGALSAFVVVAVLFLAHIFLTRGALAEVGGIKAGFGTFFGTTHSATAVATAVVVSVLTSVGYALFYVPGVVAAFLTLFAVQFAVDRGQSAFAAIASAATLSIRYFPQVLVLALALGVINAIGAVPFGLGLLVTVPLSVIATTYAYRRIAG